MTEPTLTQSERAIKLADRDLIAAAGGIAAVAAHFLFQSTSLVGRWHSVTEPKFMPSPRRQDLEDLVGPVATRAAALRQGFTLVKLPEGGTPSAHDLHTTIAQHSRCANEVTSELVADLADGVIDPAETARGIAKCDASIEQLIALRTFLQQIAETA